jgi:uncharacterized protein YjbI with pentapeptide repeats
VIVILGGYYFEWEWTGYPKRTPWDWVDLLIVPIILALGGYLFTRSENQRRDKIAEDQRDLDRELAGQREQDEALQAYLDHMSALLTDKERPVRKARPGDDLSIVARARTLTAVRRLDSIRKVNILQFLYESNLISKDHRVVDLSNANLREVNLSRIDLRDADLRGVDLRGASLVQTDLRGADLRFSVLRGIYMWMADLRGADLREADLSMETNNSRFIDVKLNKANFSKANLSAADLHRADLRETKLNEAYLIATNLSEASLWGADLSGADLSMANLSGSDLSRARGWNK